ncbi:MAG: NAD(P)/FAD-dependent oxidoreductase [Opitutaceae bacterium]|nr:NAD(P)/FAD-dependent oxidoreductase [Opitutaceae bacterium]
MGERKVMVAGGGAAGFFAALACAEADPAAEITILEATAHPLAKVRISGGGRCNLTHACFDPRELAQNYPRGARELLGAFHRWQPRDTVAWFEQRGVPVKAEADGRMFPVTDDARTIVDCLHREAGKNRVRLVRQVGLHRAVLAEPGGQENRFRLTLTDGATVACGRLLLATGGGRSNVGYDIARALGHAIETPVPSLFTFNSTDPRLEGLAGVAVEDVVVETGRPVLRQRGPVLVTHWGLSGPAILKLSAWGARRLHDCGYRFALRINWAPRFNRESLVHELEGVRATQPRKQAGTWCPAGLPLRLWERLIAAAGVRREAPWASISGPALRTLAAQVCECGLTVEGKSTFKEEFVTCGGVRLSEVDFRTMESRLVPGLHFAGEVLDIDGITGGFNFQAAWTTGWLAGRAMGGA